ncbi:hypothetical protein EV714DRAFT_240382, partial [Schizophyllum commune]
MGEGMQIPCSYPDAELSTEPIPEEPKGSIVVDTEIHQEWQAMILAVDDMNRRSTSCNDNLALQLSEAENVLRTQAKKIAEIQDLLEPSPSLEALQIARANVESLLTKFTAHLSEVRGTPSMARLKSLILKDLNTVCEPTFLAWVFTDSCVAQLLTDRLRDCTPLDQGAAHDFAFESDAALASVDQTKTQLKVELSGLEALLQTRQKEEEESAAIWSAQRLSLEAHLQGLRDDQAIGAPAVKDESLSDMLQANLLQGKANAEIDASKRLTRRQASLSASISTQRSVLQDVKSSSAQSEEKLALVLKECRRLFSEKQGLETITRVAARKLEKQLECAEEQLCSGLPHHVAVKEELENRISSLALQINVLEEDKMNLSIAAAEAKSLLHQPQHKEEQRPCGPKGKSRSSVGPQIAVNHVITPEAPAHQSYAGGQPSYHHNSGIEDSSDSADLESDEEELHTPTPSLRSVAQPSTRQSISSSDEMMVDETPIATPRTPMVLTSHQLLKGANVADQLAQLKTFRLGTPIGSPSPSPRSTGLKTPSKVSGKGRARPSPYSRAMRPLKLDAPGSEDEAADNEGDGAQSDDSSSSSEDEVEQGRRATNSHRRTGGSRQPVARSSRTEQEETSDESDSDSDMPEKATKISQKYAAMQCEEGEKYSPKQKKSNFNRVVLSIILKGLGIKHLYQVVSLECASESDLESFEAGVGSGPDVASFRMDTRPMGGSKAILQKRVEVAVDTKISRKVRTGKYGVVDDDRIQKAVSQRFRRVYRLIASTQVLDGETWEQAAARHMENHLSYNERSRVLGMRHT